MSDPVTNVEIEDVLSSIRRLVSEEGRPRNAQDQVAERLVLSPSLRVADPVSDDLPEPEAVPEPLAGQDPATDADPVVDEADPMAEYLFADRDKAEAMQTEAPMVLTQRAAGPVVPEEAQIAEPGPELLGPAQEASLILDEDQRADETEAAFAAEPGMLDVGDDVDVGEEASVPDAEEDGELLAEAMTAPNDLPEDPAPEDYAEAEQLAALRASLTDILAPAEDLGPDADELTETVQSWSEDGEPFGEALDEVTGPPTLAHKIATLEEILYRQSGKQNPEADVARGESGTFEAFEAERAAPDMRAPDPELVEEPGLPENTADLSAMGDGSSEDVTSEAMAPEVDMPEPRTPEPDLHAVAPEEGSPDQENADNAVSEDTQARTPDPISSLIQDRVQAELATMLDQSEDAGSPDEPLEEDTEAARAAFLRHGAGQSSLDWEDHIPGAEPDPVTEPEPPAEPAAHSVPAELDEEALHALVANIVRQELQGALGERITRNVRKLVRREIHRVLMSQEFD